MKWELHKQYYLKDNLVFSGILGEKSWTYYDGANNCL